MENIWEQKLVPNLVYLQKTLDCSTSFIGHLRECKVLNRDHVEDIQQRRTTSDKVYALIEEYLHKRPEHDYYLFLTALIETGQDHIAERIAGPRVLEWRKNPNCPQQSLESFLSGEETRDQNLPQSSKQSLQLVKTNNKRYQELPSRADTKRRCLNQYQHCQMLPGKEFALATAAENCYATSPLCDALGKNPNELQMVIGDYAMGKLGAAHMHLSSAMIIMHVGSKGYQTKPYSADGNSVTFRESLLALGRIAAPQLLVRGFSLEIDKAYNNSMEAVNICHNDLGAQLHALEILLLCLVYIHPECWSSLWMPYLYNFMRRKDVQLALNMPSAPPTSPDESLPSTSTERLRDEVVDEITQSHLLDFLNSVRGILKKVGYSPPHTDDIPDNTKESSPELFEALAQKNERLVNIVLAMGSNPDAADETQRTALTYAIQQDVPLGTIEHLIDYNADVNKFTENGTPLFWASVHNNVGAAKALLERGANTRTNYDGEFAIHVAAAIGAVDIIAAFEKKGCDVDVFDYKQGSIESAIAYGKQDVVEKVHESGTDIVLQHDHQYGPYDPFGDNSPFYSGIHFERHYVGTMKALISAGLRPGTADFMDQCSLHHAALCGDIRIIEDLLNKGADVTAPFSSRRINVTPLHIAAWYDHEAALTRMLQEFPHWNRLTRVVDSHRRTLLHYAAACSRDNTNIINLLIKEGLKLDKCCDGWITPLHIAARYGHINTFVTCFEHFFRSPPMRQTDSKSRTFLHHAAMSNNIEVTRFLIGKGFDVNMQIGFKTPLHIAARYGSLEVAMELIAEGADIHALSLLKRNNVLHYVCKSNKYDDASKIMTIKRLAWMGVHVDARNNNGRTPLHYAVIYKNDICIIEQLIAVGANVTAADNEGYTTLHHFCSHSDPRDRQTDRLRSLLKNGADINAKSFNGSTPLHMAADHDDLALLEALTVNNVCLHLCDRQKNDQSYQ